VYAASDGLSTVVIETDVPGGQASYISLIENFFGFPDGIGGAELARLAGRQAEGFGAELMILRGVVGSAAGAAGLATIQIAGGYELSADVVMAATGMDWRRLDAAGVEELVDRRRLLRRRPQRGCPVAAGTTSSSSTRATPPGRRC
jgi:thioredoxin reductase (NADPH)